MSQMSRRAALKVGAMTAAGLAGGLRLTRTVVASDQYSSVVLGKGPVGYWRLGEAQGPVASDASGNGADGTYLGNPTFGQPGAINGDTDTAVGLNGPASADYIEITDPASQAFSQPTSGQGLTVEAWMRPDVLTFPGIDHVSDIYIHWLGKCVSGSGQCEWGFRFYSLDSPTRPNRISAYIWNPDGALGAGAYFQETLTAQQWIHVVAAYEPGDKDTVPPAGVHIYMNGVHKQGPPSSGTLYSSFGIVPAHGTLPVRLGTRDAAVSGDHVNSYFTGGLDEVAIYPRVLTAAEILENYCTGSDAC